MRPRIYARVSTEKQEKEETIQSQLAGLREFGQKDDLSVDHEYIDDGYSGELLDRPALDRLRDDAKKGLFDTLLVHSPDRLSRNFVHLCLLRDELARHGVKIIYLNRPERGDTPEDKLLENVEGVVAEYEKAKILERTRRASSTRQLPDSSLEGKPLTDTGMCLETRTGENPVTTRSSRKRPKW